MTDWHWTYIVEQLRSCFFIIFIFLGLGRFVGATTNSRAAGAAFEPAWLGLTKHVMPELRKIKD